MSTSDQFLGAHILVFPYPAMGHIIPLLDLAHHFLTRGFTVTVLVTTPPHLSLLDPLLSSHPTNSIQPLFLSPPDNTLANSNLFRPVANTLALSQLRDPITQWFKSHPSPPVAIVSDMFLAWTHHLASDLGISRVAFWTSGAYAASIFNTLWRHLPRVDDPDDGDSVLSVPNVPNSPKYPWWQITTLYRLFEKGDPNWELFRNGMLANSQSWGAVFDSFTELERVSIQHIKKEMGHDRVWPVGPLLPDGNDLLGPNNRGGSSSVSAHEVMGWLDSKADDSVVYVCFGSRWTLTSEQVGALAAALECSGVHFIWCLKDSDLENAAISDGFENRVVGKGFLIKGWAPQVAILRHRAVGAFVTHCGWNSVLEGLAAGVLMLTWPMAADQFTNANLLVDQIEVGVRFCECGTRTVPDSGKLSRLLAESVGGTRPERPRVMEMCNSAREAMKGGSSSIDMEALVNKLCGLNKPEESVDGLTWPAN